jgi:hypothetical protein
MNNRFLLTSALFLSFAAVNAQNNKMTYAITGDGNKDFVWMNIRQVDLTTGQITKTIFERSKSAFTLTDLQTKKTVDQNNTTPDQVFNATEYPTGTFVAAAAFDKRTNKLFFTPMRKGQLRWLDMNEADKPHFYSMAIDKYKVMDENDEATNITRMVIGADGIGYMLSNDGNHLFTFTTGKKVVINKIGGLVDADNNNGISIHNKCSSWGGDMIADAYGMLYVISASHTVFKIDPVSRIATYLGNIQGLPAGFTTNAAVVDDNGKIVLASANMFEGYYSMDIADLKAVKMEGSDTQYNVSDFANANVLFQKEATSVSNTKPLPTVTASDNVSIFPNPVTNGYFNILFDNLSDSRYSIVLSDLAGRPMMTKTISVAKGAQTQKIELNRGMAKGVYIVKVLDQNKNIMINEKVIVQ